MPIAISSKAMVTLFQSAPGREAGRCSCARYSSRAHYLFQSAPGREAGRCSHVSATRLEGASSFNPRPAVRPGDAR